MNMSYQKKNVASLKKLPRENLPKEESKIEEMLKILSKKEISILFLNAHTDGGNYLRLSIGVKDVDECPPVDLYCMVDVSGSMGWSCAGKTDGHT